MCGEEIKRVHGWHGERKQPAGPRAVCTTPVHHEPRGRRVLVAHGACGWSQRRIEALPELRTETVGVQQCHGLELPGHPKREQLRDAFTHGEHVRPVRAFSSTRAVSSARPGAHRVEERAVVGGHYLPDPGSRVDRGCSGRAACLQWQLAL